MTEEHLCRMSGCRTIVAHDVEFCRGHRRVVLLEWFADAYLGCYSTEALQAAYDALVGDKDDPPGGGR